MKAAILALMLATATVSYTPREVRLWGVASRAAGLADARTLERDSARRDVATLQRDLGVCREVASQPSVVPESHELQWFVIGTGAGVLVGVVGMVVGLLAVR